MKPVSVASVGECMIELSQGADGRWDLGYAGDAFNTLWTLRALLPEDATTDFVTAFGDDRFSAAQRAFFAAHGIGVADSPTIPKVTPGLYAITLDGHERSFTYWRGAAAARKLADDREALSRSLGKRDLIYFSGITLAILPEKGGKALLGAIAEARGHGSLVAFDPNYREGLWPDAGKARDLLTRVIGMVDIILPTFDDERALHGDETPQATVERMIEHGAGEVIVKCGSYPAVFKADGIAGSLEAERVDRPVDTTGAGDAFNGGYISARLNGDDIGLAVRKGHEVAASAVRTRGALVRLPRRSRLL